MDRPGFTLVEVVMVVLIIGILAVIAAPNIINKSDEAMDTALAANLVSIRDALGLYQATYKQLPPGTLATCDLPAALDEFLRGATFPMGGKDSNRVKNVNGTPRVQVGVFGWVYSIDKGEVIVNSGKAMILKPSMTFDAL